MKRILPRLIGVFLSSLIGAVALPAQGQGDAGAPASDRKAAIESEPDVQLGRGRQSGGLGCRRADEADPQFYGAAGKPVVNLVNAANLTAYPFRTEHEPDIRPEIQGQKNEAYPFQTTHASAMRG